MEKHPAVPKNLTPIKSNSSQRATNQEIPTSALPVDAKQCLQVASSVTSEAQAQASCKSNQGPAEIPWSKQGILVA